MDPHTSLGIAIICLFAPVCLVDAFLLFHRHGRPRMPWYFLFTFSLCKFSGSEQLDIA
jgi:hypothetical protein